MDVNAHPQVVENVHSMETLLNNYLMASLREVHGCCKIEFPSYSIVNKSTLNKIMV